MPNEKLFYKLKESLLINGIILFISLIFIFFGLFDVPFGFLLGTVVLVINKIILHYEQIFEDKFAVSPWKSLVDTLTHFFAYFLLVFVTFISLYLEHRGINLFSWISVLFAYFVGESPLILKKIFKENIK